MLYSIKPQSSDFNLLYLTDGEILMNSINCYYFNINTKSVDDSILHLNTRSLIIQPKEISRPLVKLGFSENLSMKMFTFEDILNLNIALKETNYTYNSNTYSNPNSNLVTSTGLNTNYASSSNNLNNVLSTNMNTNKDTNQKQSYLQKNSVLKRQLTSVNNVGPQNFVQLYNDLSQGTLNQNSSNNLKNLGKKIVMINQINNINRINSKDSKELKEVNSYNTNTAASGNYTSKYIENLNSSMKKSNNKQHSNSQSTKYFNLKLTNISLLFDKVFTDNTGVIATMNNNMTNFFSVKSSSVNNSNNINLNASTQNSQINSNKKQLASGSLGIFDLLNFFQENFLNLNKFCDVVSKLQTNFLQENKVNLKYYILFFRCNRSHYITRKPISNYDVNLTPQSYFLIMEGEESICATFLNDRKFVMETLFKCPTEDKELESHINKKISDLSDILEKTKNQKETAVVTNMNSSKPSEENKIIFKSRVSKLLPEGIQHGLLILIHQTMNGINTIDNKYIEFIPVTNNYKIRSCTFKLNKVQSMVTYRYLYKDLGLNIFLYQSKRSKIFIFEKDSDHKFVMNYIYNNSRNINKNYGDIKYHTELWSNGLLSNFDYLMYLNIMGSRSFNDLSQYPVFPWVITNYEDSDDFDISEEKNYRDLSKPIGALNAEKFEKFNKKYLEMKLNSSHCEPPYFFGKHYSTPAYVIYYLTRAFPHLQLQIQGGSFGPAERMFNSIKDCWDYLYFDMIRSEVMELIPEFYKSDGEFLLNIHNIHLDKNKSSGKSINEVALPKWAKSGSDFINICRSALESEYVSSNINNWIDLIFGNKQRGEAAEANDNLFYHVTYDNYNYDEFPEDKKFSINQILQFGQTPRQLFLEAHPKKKGFDMLNYEIISNPKEISGAIEKYKRENEKLENTYKKMIDAKFMDKQKLIGIYRDIDKKKNEKINKLKEQSKIQEDSYREIIDKMIEQNNILKEKFVTYDSTKEKIYKDSISKMVEEHENDKKNIYSNQINLSDHVKNLEISINQSKIRQSKSIEQSQNLQEQLDKQNKINENLKKQISQLQKKLDTVENYTNLQNL